IIANARFLSPTRNGIGIRIRVFPIPEKARLRDWHEFICIRGCKLNFVLIGRVSETKPKIHRGRDLPAEMQDRVGTASPENVVLQRALPYRVEKRKHANEIRFARTIRPDNDIDGPEMKVLNRSKALEASDSDCVEFGHGPSAA